jgi:hypothetical protein
MASSASPARAGLILAGLLLVVCPVGAVRAEGRQSPVVVDDSTSEGPRHYAAAPIDGGEDGTSLRSEPGPAAPSPEAPTPISVTVGPSLVPSRGLGAKQQDWLVVVIQATLAEKGCYQGPINGQWNAATQGVTEKLAKLANFRTPAAPPTHQLLEDIRIVPTKLCKDSAPITKAAMRTGTASGHGPRAAATAGRHSERAAPRQAAGPAVFARPVGLGRF